MTLADLIAGQCTSLVMGIAICAGSQSQRKAMLLLNVHTENFDNRPGVDKEGAITTNHEVDATLDLYDVVAVALHLRGIAMSRVAIVTLSSDCTTTGTVTAKHEYRYPSGQPRPTSKGAEAAADFVMRRTVKRLRRERATLAQTQQPRLTRAEIRLAVAAWAAGACCQSRQEDVC